MRIAVWNRPTVSSQATWDVHVLPYFHGNRHPRADPSLRGMISGLRLGRSIEDLAVLYMATLEAIIYGARHLIEALNKAGHQVLFRTRITGAEDK